MSKIEGFVPSNQDRFYGPPGIRIRTVPLNDAKERPSDIPATLVIGSPGDTSAPRVFTEQEVKAMLNDLMKAQHSADIQNGMVPIGVDFIGIASRYGIDLLHHL